MLAAMVALSISACKDVNHAEGTLSPIMAISDVRALYKGEDVHLGADAMLGAHQIVGTVVSDHAAGNMPSGLVVIQNLRRFFLKGIAISIGDAAASYVPGDSVVVDVTGGVLTRTNGILQITGLTNSAVTKVSSGIPLEPRIVNSNLIVANPDDYESTLVAVVKAGFNPLPNPEDRLAGTWSLNDGFDNLPLHTEPDASFADESLPISANFTGVVFGTAGSDIPQLRLRSAGDIQELSSEINITPIVVAGFIANTFGTDANYEYLQFMATRDIDFSATPFSVVTTNNAGASTPTGFPVRGWATGGLRTYKFDLTSGQVQRGEFFYVGGTAKRINGAASTDISDANWIAAIDYSTVAGAGFGNATENLLANSGNAAGIAVFEGTDVTAVSKPLDVVFFGGGGNLFAPGPPAQGYRIVTNDYYDEVNVVTLGSQPFFNEGSNTRKFAFAGETFSVLGGVYNDALGRWTSARQQISVAVQANSTLEAIEGTGSTRLHDFVEEESEGDQ